MSKWLVTLTVMLPTIIEIIDMTVVNVSLAHIRGSLGGSFEESTWILTMYMVANAIIIPITGWLSRLFGRRNYLVISILMFTCSSFLCGVAWSIPALVVFRIFQGIGGGGLQPISQAILLETFPKEEHGTAMAVYGAGTIVGPIFGPMLGGWITDNWSWHWIFFINIPIGIISMAMALLFVKDPPWAKRQRITIDYPGLILVAVGVGSLQIMLDQGQLRDWFSSNLIKALAFVSIGALFGFVLKELKTKEPIIELRIFKDRSFSMGNLSMFSLFLALFGTIVLVPQYVQALMGYTAFLAGLVIGPGGLVTVLSLFLTGRLVGRMNPKVLMVTGILIVAYSSYMMSGLNLQADFWDIVWPRIVLGFGMGFIFIPTTILTLGSISKEAMGMATSIFAFVRNIGGSIGGAFVATMLARRAQFHQARLVEGLTPFDLPYQMGMERLKGLLALRGLSEPSLSRGSEGLIYSELLRQASMLSFNDLFFLLTFLFLLCIPFMVAMRRVKEAKGVPLLH